MTANNAAPASRRRLTSCGELFALGRGAAMLAAPSRAPLVARRVFMYSTQPRRASRSYAVARVYQWQQQARVEELCAPAFRTYLYTSWEDCCAAAARSLLAACKTLGMSFVGISTQ